MERNLQQLGATLLRVALGAMFVSHGALKLFVFTMPGTVKFFASLGLPPALAYLTVFAELVGGALILVGYHGRWVSAALIPILLGATWAHAGNGWVFSVPNGGWEYPAFLALAALVHALVGDGFYALANAGRAHKLRQEAFA